MKFVRIICLAFALLSASFLSAAYADDASYRYPLIKNKAAEFLGDMQYKPSFLPNDYTIRKDLVKKYASNKDLRPLIKKMFAVADSYIAAVNRHLDTTEAAAKSCDRAKYNAAKNDLINAYVKASLALQNQMSDIDALIQAGAESDQQSAYYQAKLRWSLFWANVHDTIGNFTITPQVKEIWDKTSTSYRAALLGDAYSAAYGDTLKKMKAVIDTANYPEFQDCDEPEKGPTLAEANRALAEAMEAAAQNAIDEMAPELAELDEIYAQIDKTLDKYIGDADLPDNTDKTPENGVNSLASGVASTGNVGELPIIPDPKQNHDGSFQTPDFGNLVVAPEIDVNVPDMPNIPAVPKNSPLAKIQADPCGQNPEKVCSVLLKGFRKDCVKTLKGFYKICQQGPSIKNCKKRCEANWQQGVHEQDIAQLAKKHIRAIYGTSEKTHESDYEGKEAEIKANKARIKQIEDEAKKRILHIYIDTNTDTVIRHNGHKFKPKPPLRYAGTEGGGIHMHERNEIEYLKARNKQLRQEIDGLVDSTHDDNAWLEMALSKWTADTNKNDGLCTPAQNDANRDACVAECEGNATAAVQNTCYSSFVPQLVMPYGRAYLYPPGHPESDPKKGIEALK